MYAIYLVIHEIYGSGSQPCFKVTLTCCKDQMCEIRDPCMFWLVFETEKLWKNRIFLKIICEMWGEDQN